MVNVPELDDYDFKVYGRIELKGQICCINSKVSVDTVPKSLLTLA